MDVSTVYEMFEEINKKLDKQTVEPMQVDLTAINSMTEQFEDVIKEVRKPVKVEHRHKIEIASNWFFLSWIALVLIILGLFWAIGNQRQTISQYKDNDLKYRYIKMQGQTNEENLYRIEQQFKYNDSIKIIHKQVEKYEELVKEQVEKIERAKQNNKEAKQIKKEVESLKRGKQKSEAKNGSSINCQILHYNNLIITNLQIHFRQYMTPPKNIYFTTLYSNVFEICKYFRTFVA
jgi:hypothetical protein